MVIKTKTYGSKRGLGLLMLLVILIDGHVLQVFADSGSSSAEKVMIEKFEIRPPRAIAGQTCVLEWRTRNAVAAHMSGVGSVPVNGQKKVTVGKRRTYVLTVKDSQGHSISESRRISWVPLAPGRE